MVKRFFLTGIWILLTAMVADAVGSTTTTAATNANDRQVFQFKFDGSKPLIYAIEMKTANMNDVHVGQRSSLTRTTVDTRYKIRLTAIATNDDGTVSVYYEPFDYRQDSRTVGPSGEIESTTRDLAIVSKQNGIVVVDTAKGIGQSQWPVMKQATYPHLLSGYMDFGPTGHINRFSGDLPFVDNWQHTLEYNTNLFYIVFPIRGIAVGDTWTNDYDFKTAGPVIFDGDGIVQPWTYTRGPDEVTTNGTVASFSLDMTLNDKDLSGYLDQTGQRTAIDIPVHSSSMDATFLFDQKQGRLVSIKETDNSQQDINMVVQGNSATGHSEGEGTVSITLISP